MMSYWVKIFCIHVQPVLRHWMHSYQQILSLLEIFFYIHIQVFLNRNVLDQEVVKTRRLQMISTVVNSVVIIIHTVLIVIIPTHAFSN